MVTKIPLTQGLFALVDDEDAALVNQYKWYANLIGQTYYAVRMTWKPGGKRGTLYMHTLLTGFERTDHMNGNGLDNRRCNLRDCTSTGNMRNRRKCKKPTSSKFKGVCWDKNKSRFMSQIRIDSETNKGKREKYIGRFRSEIEAARAYDAAAREYFGEYAALNFPNPGERSALTGEITPFEGEVAA